MRLALPAGQFVLPGNRWDLLDGVEPVRPTTVSVVIPYFQAQHRLDLLLTALSLQTHPHELVEVIVADDGSRVAPCLDLLIGIRGRVVRQEDRGFRAAAARNLGAAASSGEVLVFLDDDTYPEPDYLRRLVRLPALAPDAIVTGRRRHADFADWSPARVREWCAGAPGPPELVEPTWLADEHGRTSNLLDIGPESYRYVISAVLACSRRLFDEIGGFDETLVGYGGEDWELAHRALCAGAVLAHVPQAVAWHDGPDWALRGTAESRRRAKNAETAALARRIPDFGRFPMPWAGPPNVVVELETGDEEPAAVSIAARSLLAGPTSCAVRLRGPQSADLVRHFGGDPRIGVDDGSSASARLLLRMSRPLVLGDAFWDFLSLRSAGRITVHTPDGVLEVAAAAAVRRAARWQTAFPERDMVDELFGSTSVDGVDVGVRPVPRRPELAHELNQPISRS